MTITDPRERLIVAGSAVLGILIVELLFLECGFEQIKALRNKDDTEAANEGLGVVRGFTEDRIFFWG